MQLPSPRLLQELDDLVLAARVLSDLAKAPILHGSMVHLFEPPLDETHAQLQRS